MENQENRFAKTSSEAIKSIVCGAVPGNKRNPTIYALNVFEDLAEFTQISFVADLSGGSYSPKRQFKISSHYGVKPINL